MRILALIALVSFFSTACKNEGEEANKGSSHAGNFSNDGVAACFASYKSAILGQDGESAVNLLSRNTIEAYKEYVDLARNAERNELESLSFINRMQVIIMRHRIPVDELRALDGRSAIVYAVDRDWIGKDGVIRTELGQIDIADGRATAEIKVGGQKAPNRIQFRYEEGKWKLDLISLLRDSNTAMKEAARRAQMEENDFLFVILESISGKKVDDSIWSPVE